MRGGRWEGCEMEGVKDARREVRRMRGATHISESVRHLSHWHRREPLKQARFLSRLHVDHGTMPVDTTRGAYVYVHVHVYMYMRVGACARVCRCMHAHVRACACRCMCGVRVGARPRPHAYPCHCTCPCACPCACCSPVGEGVSYLLKAQRACPPVITHRYAAVQQ